MKPRLLILLAASLLLAADAKEDEGKKERKKLQGTWSVVSIEVNGEQVPMKDFKDFRWVITADKITWKDGKRDQDFNYELGPTQKPKTIDLLFPERGAQAKDQAIPGIYSLEGDTLKISYGKKKRPAEFKTQKGGDKQALFVLKREKP